MGTLWPQTRYAGFRRTSRTTGVHSGVLATQGCVLGKPWRFAGKTGVVLGHAEMRGES